MHVLDNMLRSPFTETIPCIDFSGTLVHHETRQALPLAAAVLRSFERDKRKAYISSRYDKATTVGFAQKAGLLINPDQIIHAGRRSEAVREIARREGVEEARIVVIDDKPDNLADVQEHTHAMVIGMLGSGRHADRLGRFCAEREICMTFTPANLCDVLGSKIEENEIWKYRPGYRDTRGTLREKLDALIWLTAGLCHPMSVFAGRTYWFDHRWVISSLLGWLENVPLDELREVLPAFWQRMALILCDDCMWKIHARTVLMYAGRKDYDWADMCKKAYEISAMMNAGGYANIDSVQQAFRRSTKEMLRGILGCWMGGQDWRIHQAGVFSRTANYITDADAAARLRCQDWDDEDSARCLLLDLEQRREW